MYGHLAALCTSTVTKITTTHLLGSHFVIYFSGKESSGVWKEHITDPDGVVIIEAGQPVDGPRKNRYPHLNDPRGPALEITSYGISLYTVKWVSVNGICVHVCAAIHEHMHAYAHTRMHAHTHARALHMHMHTVHTRARTHALVHAAFVYAHL